MPRITQRGEFFVVGGPVQPDRDCYIERAADELLAQALLDRRFCYVLGPKATGKSSLMARTIRGLRAGNQLAAVVDLTQIGARGESAEAGRWYYSIAHRIVRELRIKIDLQTWWQEKSLLVNEQRLADFFWEIVLANTSTSVTIFFDEIERTIELPFSRELLAALRACYDGRATEPDYQRLNFAVLGVASPRQLARGLASPLFEDGLAVDPGDFTLDQTYRLAAGFEPDETRARAALDRIYHWVKGQPYLTQKIARAVARRRGGAAEVDDIVHGQFLSTGAREDEPLLNHVAAMLTEDGPRRRRALVLLDKLAKGVPIVADPESASQELLSLAGVAASSDDGEFLTYRNRLMREVFTSRWVKSALPFDWRGAAIAAAAVAAMILLPLWYTQYFPRPYIETLTSVGDDYATAIDTHDKLRRFPGFGARADRLLADIMVRRSENASSYAEVTAADEVLRSLDGYRQTADRLMGAYWLRRADAAVLAARRDEALVYADLARIGGDSSADRTAERLIDSDYAFLTRSYRFPAALSRWSVDWGSSELTVIGAGREARRLTLEDEPLARYDVPLTALQHVPVSRELGVDEPGSAGAFLFEIDIEHPDEEQIMLTLEAPSGARVSFGLPPSAESRREIRVTEQSVLASLADEDRQGVWRLTLIDRAEGGVGQLNGWGLLFAEELRGWEDEPDDGLRIPDPLRTEQVDVQLSADGGLGVARPSRAGAIGALSLWDLRAGTHRGDLQVEEMPTYSDLTPDARRLVTVASNTLTIWDVESGASVARIEAQSGFLLPPAVGVDGEYIAIAERLDADSALYSLLRAEDGQLVASVEGSAGIRDWVLGPQARYLIVVGPSRGVRLVDPRRGDSIAELPHEVEPVLVGAPTDDLLLSVDAAGDIYVWRFSEAQRGAPLGQFVGVTVDPRSISVAEDDTVLAYQAEHSHVIVRDLANNTVRFSARIDPAGGAVRTRLAPDGGSLVTASGSLLQVWQIAGPALVPRPNADVSAMALDETAQIVALGYRDGHLQIRTTAQLRQGLDALDEIEYIGHQGPVSTLAINSARGVIASGGRDGVVRVWDLASGAPTPHYLRLPEGPVNAVAVSADGRRVAGAAEEGARLWSAEDGQLAREVPVNGAALAVAVAPDASRFAAGDSAGNVFVVDLEASQVPRSGRAQAAVTALAFASDGGVLASGDRSGSVQLWSPDGARPLGNPLTLPQPIRWLGFARDDRYLLVQTDHWAHRLAVDDTVLQLVASRLVGIDREAGMSPVPGSDTVRLVGGRDLGAAEVEDLSWSSSAGSRPRLGPVPIDRDWAALLGLRVDDSANVVEVTY